MKNKTLHDMSDHNLSDIFNLLETSEAGLSSKEAARRLEDKGLNEVTYEKRKPWYIYLLRAFVDPFILILLFIVVISYFTDVAFVDTGEKSYITMLIISILILISVVLRFTQEFKSQITADNLKDLVPTTTAIQRDGLAQKKSLCQMLCQGILFIWQLEI